MWSPASLWFVMVCSAAIGCWHAPAPATPPTRSLPDLRCGDWQPAAAGAAPELLDLAHQLAWDAQPLGDVNRPGECALRIATHCAPDLTADGSDELLVEYHWRVPINDVPCGSDDDHGEWWPGYAVIVVTPTAGSRTRPLGIVIASVEDGQTETQSQWTGFVRLADGRIGLEVARSWAASDTGCQHRSSSVVALGINGLTTVSTRQYAADCE